MFSIHFAVAFISLCNLNGGKVGRRGREIEAGWTMRDSRQVHRGGAHVSIEPEAAAGKPRLGAAVGDVSLRAEVEVHGAWDARLDDPHEIPT